MLAPLFRKVTHLMPMRCASATNRSTVALGCFVVGTQCIPRPLSPLGCGYASRGSGPAHVLGSAWRVGWGLGVGNVSGIGFGRCVVGVGVGGWLRPRVFGAC